jgi:hypothetical protein
VRDRDDGVIASLRTNDAGIAGISKPPDVPADEIQLVVHHPDYNPRHMRLDGSNLVPDLRRRLYGND